MKKYLKRGLTVLTCAAMCIQSPLITMAEEIQRTNGEASAYQADNYGVATQAQKEPQWIKDSAGWWYQNADGSVTIPEALRPYMGGDEVIKP